MTNKEFRLVYSVGKKVYSTYARIIFLPGDELKVGIVVSSKHGGAVVRNKVKRRIKEFFREIPADFVMPKGFLVVMPKVGIKNISYEEIKVDMVKALKKAQLVS